MKELTKAIQQKKAVIGSKLVLKKLKTGGLSRIYLSRTSSQELRDDVAYYAKIADVEVIQSDQTSADFGILCKKQYNIQAIGIIK